PAAMFGRVVKLQALQQPVGFRRRERLVQGRRRMGIEIVHHKANDLGIRIIAVDQQTHTLCKVAFGAAVGHLDMPPPLARLKEHEQVARPLALILVIVALRRARLREGGCPHFLYQLGGGLVHIYHRIARIIRLRVQIEYVFHVPDKLGTHGRDTPLLLQPGLGVVFFRVRRIVSSEIVSTKPTSTTRSASNCSVQRWRPSGRVLQANAMTNASSLPCNFGLPPGRGRSVSAHSIPPSTKRLRVRSTVLTPMCKALAIAASVYPSAASSNSWARRSLRATTSPFFPSACNCPRSSSVSSTRYRFAMALL